MCTSSQNAMNCQLRLFFDRHIFSWWVLTYPLCSAGTTFSGSTLNLCWLAQLFGMVHDLLILSWSDGLCSDLLESGQYSNTAIRVYRVTVP